MINKNDAKTLALTIVGSVLAAYTINYLKRNKLL